MSDKNSTVYVNARKAEMDALNIELCMRLKLSDWDLVNHGLLGLSGVANPIREMISELASSLRNTHRTAALRQTKDVATPTASAEFDSDDLMDLLVLMRFTFTLEQWNKLAEQLNNITRSDALDRMYNAIATSLTRLNSCLTVKLVVPSEVKSKAKGE